MLNKSLNLQGSKTSDKLLESFAEKLAEVFIQGELCISDWSSEKGAEIKVCRFTKRQFCEFDIISLVYAWSNIQKTHACSSC